MDCFLAIGQASSGTFNVLNYGAMADGIGDDSKVDSLQDAIFLSFLNTFSYNFVPSAGFLKSFQCCFRLRMEDDN